MHSQITVKLNETTSFLIHNPSSLSHIHSELQRLFSQDSESYLLKTISGKIATNEYIKSANNIFLHLHFKILGGKGGFGSNLRAQGGRMDSKKSTNFEACRDLQGRRLKTINEAKHLAIHLAQEPERKRLKEEKLNKKIKEGLEATQVKKIRFDDQEYLEDHEKSLDSVKLATQKIFLKEKNVPKPAISFSSWDEEVLSSSSDDEEKPSSKVISTKKSIVVL